MPRADSINRRLIGIRCDKSSAFDIQRSAAIQAERLARDLLLQVVSRGNARDRINLSFAEIETPLDLWTILSERSIASVSNRTVLRLEESRRP